MSSEALIAASGRSTHEHRKATRKMRWWYEALADHLISNPKITNKELAVLFNRNETTISIVMNTDAFKAYMRQRRNDLALSLDQSVRSKLLELTDLSLDTLVEKVTKKKDTLPVADLQRISEMSLKALGYGVEKPVVINNPPSQQTTIVVPVSLEDLQQAQQALRASQRQMVDITPVDPQGRRDNSGDNSEAVIVPSDANND